MTDLRNLPRKAFYDVPARVGWDTYIECTSIVMLPLGIRLHDSGYRFMDAVACLGNELIARVSGCSDVFMLNAPSHIWTKERTPRHTHSLGIDSLKRSGLMRVFLFDADMLITPALSTLSIYPINRLETAS